MTRLLSLFLCLALCGCASFQNTGGKVLTSTALTVDAAMKGWAKWAHTHPVSEESQASVRGAYAKYQSAMSAAVEAYAAAVNAKDKTIWTQSADALDASSASLIQLIHTLAPP
jgi:hypothetical protein